jgi:NADP-dependent 3-hydroxy acid dehydrogenase YdfG
LLLLQARHPESAQEKSHIRTTTIYPGAVDTGLMTNSGNDSNNVQFTRMSPSEVANAVAYAIDQPENVSVGNITISAQA